MISAERREKIKTVLLEKKSITVAEMAELFEVSTETIRRDFESLNKEGFLVKSYGGATLAFRKKQGVSQHVKSSILVDVKKRLAKRAARLVKPNDCIFLDHSTTVYEMCDELIHMPLTVMTNSLAVMNRFADCPGIKLVAPGGNFDTVNQAFFGLEAVGYLQRHCVDKAFLSCRTLDIKRGLNDAEEMIADMRRNIVENADFTCLLSDHTKFNRTAFIQTCDFQEIDCLVTDWKLDDIWRGFLEDMDVECLECDEV